MRCERMEKIRDCTGADSVTEVIRRAPALYDAMLVATAGGLHLILRDKSGKETEIVLPKDIV